MRHFILYHGLLWNTEAPYKSAIFLFNTFWIRIIILASAKFRQLDNLDTVTDMLE